MKLMLILTLTITLGMLSNAEEVIDKRKEARSGWYGSRYNGYLDSDENYGYGSFIKGNSNFGYLDDSREGLRSHNSYSSFRPSYSSNSRPWYSTSYSRPSTSSYFRPSYSSYNRPSYSSYYSTRFTPSYSYRSSHGYFG
ncbi:UNVERIFIED_CONTAM: hypothetical protein RMT77_009520 [Armadillidium vulgare]